MGRVGQVFVILVAAMLIAGCPLMMGCSATPAQVKTQTPGKLENIERIFFMGKGCYAVLIPQENGELRTFFLDNVKHEVHVFPDAPKEKKPWVDVQPVGRGGKTFNLHIHDAKEIAQRE